MQRLYVYIFINFDNVYKLFTILLFDIFLHIKYKGDKLLYKCLVYASATFILYTCWFLSKHSVR